MLGGDLVSVTVATGTYTPTLVALDGEGVEVPAFVLAVAVEADVAGDAPFGVGVSCVVGYHDSLSVVGWEKGKSRDTSSDLHETRAATVGASGFWLGAVCVVVWAGMLLVEVMGFSSRSDDHPAYSAYSARVPRSLDLIRSSLTLPSGDPTPGTKSIVSSSPSP